jgi:transcriptional regulator with XRE-family HTH domain
MKIHEKLRIIRMFKGYSQEEMAEKLSYSLSGYAKIERGETDLSINKLENIAELMGIDLQKILGLNEGNIFNVAENCTHSHSNLAHNNLTHCTILLSETQCAHELEKAHLLLQERDKEVENLKQQIEQLKETNALLKSKK